MTSKGPLYPNQHLVEVATEVRFRGDLSVEQARSEFQRKIFSDYPVLKAPNALQGVAPSLQPYRFETEAGHAGVQLSINSISYFAKAYQGCDEFLDAVNKATVAFFELIEHIDATRVGWRYINAIPFTREENGLLPLKRFFKENEIFGSALTLDLEQVNYSAVNSLEDCQLNVKIVTSTDVARADEEVIILDIDAFKTFSPTTVMDNTDMLSAIRHTHDIARSVFENLITDNYREFLKGGNDE